MVLSAELVDQTDAFVRALRSVQTTGDLRRIMEAISHDMGCRHYALIHHDDLGAAPVGRVDIKDYPAAVVDRLFDGHRYRRDPVMRGSLFAGQAFLWSDLPRFIRFDRFDRLSFEFGANVGLNEGITVPYVRLGDCMGSCTFAGMREPERAIRYLGLAQIIGVFAFQAALRLLGDRRARLPPPRLHPRPRDCIVLAARGMSNKEIARALALTPRTVDGYLTEARQLFNAHDRTELAMAAVLAGEVGMHELATRQPG